LTKKKINAILLYSGKKEKPLSNQGNQKEEKVMKRFLVFLSVIFMFSLCSCALLQNSTLKEGTAANQADGSAHFDTAAGPVNLAVAPETTGLRVIQFRVMPDGPFQKVELVYFTAVNENNVIPLKPPSPTFQFNVQPGTHYFNLKWADSSAWLVGNNNPPVKDGHVPVYGRLQVRVNEGNWQELTSSDTQINYGHWNMVLVVQ